MPKSSLNATISIELGNRQSSKMVISQPNMVRMSASQNHLLGNHCSTKVHEDVDPVQLQSLLQPSAGISNQSSPIKIRRK
jgi:hypothetical protein